MQNWIQKEAKDNVFLASFLLLITCIIGFWLSYTYPQYMNENMGVLLIFAERLLEGGSIGKDIYEVNPPLSILIYTPAIWLKNTFEISIHLASFLYISSWVISSSTILSYLLHKAKTPCYEKYIIIISFVLANLFVTTNDYGEREQFVLLGSMPLLLLIYLKTNGIKINNILTTVISTIGIISLLVKPHFGLLAVTLFIHRSYARKKLLAPIKDIDFIVMSMGTIIYALSLIVLFKAYTVDQLPDILAIYVTNILNPQVLILLPLFTCVLTLVLLALHSMNPRLKQQKTPLLSLFASLTLLSLISFGAQAKGLAYQFIPSAVFFWITISLYVFHNAKPYINKQKAITISTVIPLLFSIFSVYPINTVFPDENRIKELPFAQWMQQHCPQDKKCSAYIFHEAVDGIFSSFHYTDTIYASRFAAQWFFPTIMSELERDRQNLATKRLTKSDAKRLSDKFAQYVSDDFQNFKPDFVALIRTKYYLDTTNPNSESFDFDFVEHYSQYESFRQEWKNFEYIGTETVNRRDYFKGTGLDYDHLMTYDLYVRK